MLKYLCFSIVFCCALGAPWTLDLSPSPSGQLRNYNYVREEGVVYDGEDGGNDDGEDSYHSFFEKKIAKIIFNGGVYLDGLRKSLQNYARKLDNCTAIYNTFRNVNFTDPSQNTEFKKCQNAVMDKERVRRIAQLAVHTTREIQDRIIMNKEDELENKNLLLRLAWLLDKLAQMTGFEPKPEDYLDTVAATQPSTTPVVIPEEFLADRNLTEEEKMLMITCLDRLGNDTKMAYDRCSDEVPMIASMRKQYDSLKQQTSLQPSKTKRSIDNRLEDDGWKTRSIYNYGGNSISRIPEDPLQDISAYVKAKSGTDININPIQNEQLRLYMLFAFQNPNLEVVRRYGSNYNPAVPNPLYGGLLRSVADL